MFASDFGFWWLRSTAFGWYRDGGRPGWGHEEVGREPMKLRTILAAAALAAVAVPGAALAQTA